MAKKKSNSFEKSAKQKNLLKGISQNLNTKKNVKNSLLETGKDLLVGVIGGGLVGAAIGKPSLLIGIGVTGLGHYTDFQLAKLFGIGLMAANGFQDKSLKGLTGVDGVKERVNAYKENFKEKFYVTALLPKHKGKQLDGLGTAVGAVQFFHYPQDLETNGVDGYLDDGERELDYIDNQIAASGYSHMERKNINIEDVENAVPEDEDENESVPQFQHHNRHHHHQHRQQQQPQQQEQRDREQELDNPNDHSHFPDSHDAIII